VAVVALLRGRGGGGDRLLLEPAEHGPDATEEGPSAGTAGGAWVGLGRGGLGLLDKNCTCFAAQRVVRSSTVRD